MTHADPIEVEKLQAELARLQDVAAAAQRLFGVSVARVDLATPSEDEGVVNLIATCPGLDEGKIARLVGEHLEQLLKKEKLESEKRIRRLLFCAREFLDPDPRDTALSLLCERIDAVLQADIGGIQKDQNKNDLGSEPPQQGRS